MNFIRLIAAMLALIVCSSIALAQSTNPAWIDDLGIEMEREKECEIAYLLNVEERELGSEMVYSARVQCVDGRQYDATRIGDDIDDEFEIRECEIQAC